MLKEKLKGKGIGCYLHIFTMLLAIIGFIVYMASANDSYGYNIVTIIFYIAAIIVGISALFLKQGKHIAILEALLYGGAFGFVVTQRVMYFMTTFSGITSEPINMGLMLSLVLLLLMILLNIIASFFRWDKGEY